MERNGEKLQRYEKAQIVETICQLRFPTILSIDSREPADFQELIRDTFPRYHLQMENIPGKNDTKEFKNYQFISEDGGYKLSVTRNFIALSTVRYSTWTEFAGWLDQPLGHFINIYRPAYFERIGLRFVNAFSREKLGLQGERWNRLIAPQYLGVLLQPEIDESQVSKCAVDLEMKMDGCCDAKIHAGPGLIQRNIRSKNGVQTIQEKEVRFIFDEDVSVSGNIRMAAAAESLELVHSYADILFSEAVTDDLSNAMGPIYTESI